MGPEKFGELWSRRHDYDFLVGIRDGRVQTFARKAVSFVSRLCVRLFYGRGVWDVNTPYRLMRVSAFADFFRRIPLTTFAPNVILSGLAARHRLRCFETRVPQHDRTTGEVSIKKWKLLKAAVKSFGQTIALAFSQTGTKAEGTVARMARFAYLFTCLAGIGLALLSTSRANQAALFISGGLAFVAAARNGTVRRATAAARVYAERHPWRCLAVLLFAGFVLRALCFATHRDLSAFLGGDSRTYWGWARQMAAGEFPNAKSWVAPGLYAVVIRLFGDSLLGGVCLNALLHTGTAVLVFLLGRRIAGTSAGLFATAVFFFAYARCTLEIYGEHVYFALLALAFLLLTVWREQPRPVLAAMIAAVSLAVLWTRGDGGLLLFIIAPSLFLATAVLERGKRSRAVAAVAVFAAVVACGLCAGRAANETWHGTHTALCSDDSWWPRLYGCNLAFKGHWAMTLPGHSEKVVSTGDKRLILDRFEKAHGWRPRLHASECPPELVPYIRAEISRRWRAMSLRQKLRLVLHKERHVWCGVWLYKWLRPPVALFAVMTLWGLFRMWLGRPLETAKSVCDLAPLAFCLGMVCVNAIAEANSRYGWVYLLLMPLYFPFGRRRP